MTASDNWLEEIKQRLAAATPGTWRHEAIANTRSDHVDSFVHPEDWHVISDNGLSESKPTVVIGLSWYDCAWLGLSVENGAFIAHAPDDVRGLIAELECVVWIVSYEDISYLARGNELLGSYYHDRVAYEDIEQIAHALVKNVKYADGTKLFHDRLGSHTESEGDYLAGWLLAESTALLEPYEIGSEAQP